MSNAPVTGIKSKNLFTNLLTKKGGLLGSVFLLCGSSIGVGILPLPILTGHAGALPTITAFLGCGLYMTLTALLILESSLLIEEASFISLAKQFLNQWGRMAVLLSFLFLFYSLTTAYLAKGGELTHAALQSRFATPFPQWSGALTLATLSGAVIFFGPFVVDHLNRIFMGGFIATYLFLGVTGIEKIQMENLSHSNWSLGLFIIPFVITSFGYHNLVPFISNYLQQDRQKASRAFIYAGIALFFIYVLWVTNLHGIIPLNGPISITDSFAKGEIVTQPLARLIQSPLIQYSATYMAFFAIITSVLGQGLSIIDFLAEWLGFEKTPQKRLLLCAMLFLPTFACSQLIPGVFFKALELAGGVAAMVIFGIIPSILGWKQRYTKPAHPDFRPILPGGKPMLASLFSVAAFIVLYEILKNLHII
ncbi:MAG: Tyrosine-specific transport protein [Chlamydiia bacterium]|nr:Tyrosine-specific transport protein [Chlamydiia bacterium]